MFFNLVIKGDADVARAQVASRFPETPFHITANIAANGQHETVGVLEVETSSWLAQSKLGQWFASDTGAPFPTGSLLYYGHLDAENLARLRDSGLLSV